MNHMVKGSPDKLMGRGVFIDVSDAEHTGPARVRPPRAENLSERDSVAAMARLEAPQDQVRVRTQDEKPVRAWPKKSLIRGRKHKLSIMGLSEEIISKGDPRYVEMLRLANSYRKHRAREMVISHGYVSAGVSAVLSTASLALAASRFLYEKSAETGDLGLLSQASKLAIDHRQNELAAWELCAREAIARKNAAARQTGNPWELQEDKRKPGRPRKMDKVQQETAEIFGEPEKKD